MKKTPMQSFNKSPICLSGRRTISTLALTVVLLSLLPPSAKAQTPTLVLSNKWSLASAAGGGRADLDTANLTRGIAINKLTGNVLLASRTGSNHIAILSGTNGSDLGVLDNS